ncbi:RNA-induced silencing complex, nuclease component Tudor-SN [Artemisia annua]|uniref:RNA-induced silencing complex, nuclease component Tudor-SN n=1 Tax=Artemisia annua TaxID=35608 RepID=A0A2U1Q0M0_ARTAN|nr:RNA-induced silencing complex, nuclease component Tudor-SN [Artemisia annua]
MECLLQLTYMAMLIWYNQMMMSIHLKIGAEVQEETRKVYDFMLDFAEMLIYQLFIFRTLVHFSVRPPTKSTKSDSATNSQAISDNFTRKVVEVVSGDCIIVAYDALPFGTPADERRANLSSIRCLKLGNPRREEKPAPYACEAREFLRTRLIGCQVQVSMEYSRKVPVAEGSSGSRVTGFGSVFLLSEGQSSEDPEWMAPEVLQEEAVDEKTDVYSFGVIIWELLTMKLPWNGVGAAQVLILFVLYFLLAQLECYRYVANVLKRMSIMVCSVLLMDHKSWLSKDYGVLQMIAKCIYYESRGCKIWWKKMFALKFGKNSKSNLGCMINSEIGDMLAFIKRNVRWGGRCKKAPTNFRFDTACKENVKENIKQQPSVQFVNLSFLTIFIRLARPLNELCFDTLFLRTTLKVFFYHIR